MALSARAQECDHTMPPADGRASAFQARGLRMEERAKAVPTVQVSNDRMIVTEWRFAPGAETGWHRHAHDYCVVPVTDGDLLIETGGEDVHFPLVAGRSYSRQEGVEHNVVNAGEREVVFIEVELK